MRHGLSPSSKREVLFGETPYGWRLGPDRAHLVADHGEQAVIAVTRHMYASQAMSVRQIVAELAEIGVVNRRGRPFSTTRVFGILQASQKPPRDARPHKR